jgi:DNA-directed RNA polymerase specialized sigma24 family protein
MAQPESTCWTVIRGASAGDQLARERFARVYRPFILACLAGRWRDPRDRNDLEDAAHEVLIECIKEGGALAKACPDRPGGFRAFLCGVVRNVAGNIERKRSRDPARRAGGQMDPEHLPDSEASPSRNLDRAWAEALIREARELHADQARQAGPDALRRAELLQLVFHDGLKIREISARWNADAAVLHRQYAKGRKEFKAALLEVVGFHHPGTPAEVERKCADLLALLA